MHKSKKNSPLTIKFIIFTKKNWKNSEKILHKKTEIEFNWRRKKVIKNWRNFKPKCRRIKQKTLDLISIFHVLFPSSISFMFYRSLQLLQKSCGRRAATMILRVRAHWHRCNCTAALNIRSGAIRHGLRKAAKTFCRHGELSHRVRTTIWWVLGF